MSPTTTDPSWKSAATRVQVSTDGETLTWAVEDAPRVCTRDPLRDIIAKPLELGHITRLENLPGRIDTSLTQCRVQTQECQQRLLQAQAGMDKPFKYAEELAAATARYDDISATMAAEQDEPVLVPAASGPGPSPGDRATRVSELLASARAKITDPAPVPPHRRPERAPEQNLGRGIDRE